MGNFATSYIKTTSSSATRVADACYKTGISSLIGSTTGSVFVDFELFTLNGYEGVVEITGSQRLLIWRNGTSLILFTDFGAGYIDTTFAIGRHKACFTYTSSYIKFFVDGVKIGQIASTGLTGGFNKLDFENSQGGVEIQRKLINECVVSKSEFTEAEAIALTTI